MMRSLFSGVSGLQNHQTRMDVLGNNIANINTTGFKRNRVNFQDILYQQLQGASRPTAELGGTNPREVGLGMSVASIDTVHTQGSLQSTGIGTDLAISGNGFFILDNNGEQVFTRAGAFGVDADGTLVNPANGMKVQGWMAQDVEGFNLLDVSSPIGNLIIPVGEKDPAKATTFVNFASNLDRRIPEIPEGATPLEILQGTWNTQIEVFDGFGERHILQVQFTRVPGETNSWNAAVVVNPDAEVLTNTRVWAAGDDPEGDDTATYFNVNFNNNGTLLSAMDWDGNVSEAGQVALYVAFDVPGANADEEGYRHQFMLDLGQVGGFTRSITQFAEASSTRAVEQDGRPMGYLDNFRIDQMGVITGVFSNGTSRPLAQVAMASFTNQGGLEKAGDTTFRQSNNSGLANIGTARTMGRGFFISGALEMSNVDMADQFTDMIVTQRGFQANSRTIQTADQLLQEVLTLKR
ncbi:MAG: flagellar hook protein FlgE [Treponema sp.]|nr:flagellar hook protein FlgE [Treponema sp.]